MSTPEESDLLLVIAQMSVAFAGFASLASALSDRTNRDETRVDAGRLINMLVISLCTAMLALAPLIPALFGIAENVAWRLTAVLAMGTLALFTPGVLQRTKRMQQYAGFNTRSNVVNFCLTASAALGFALCAFGVPALKPSASYVTALVALLLVSAILFFRVIASVLQPHAPG